MTYAVFMVATLAAAGIFQGEAVSPMLIWLPVLIIVLMLASAWRVYVKAGQPGWAVFVPFWSEICLLKIVQKPLWWFWLLTASIFGDGLLLMDESVPVVSDSAFLHAAVLTLGTAASVVTWVVQLMISLELARSFLKSLLFGLGLMFLPFIFWPILGFGSAFHVRKGPVEGEKP